jgi:hypothetical protein
MKPLSKATLRRVMEEFPTLRWSEGDLGELVAPKFGVITGFQRFLEEVDVIVRTDLAESGMAGAVLDEALTR